MAAGCRWYLCTKIIQHNPTICLLSVFLVVSDDMVWCKRNLAASDTFMVGGNSPQVDLAIMALCNASIIDYGTFGVWGAVLAGGETIVSNKTFRDVRWAADYMGWIYI